MSLEPGSKSGRSGLSVAKIVRSGGLILALCLHPASTPASTDAAYVFGAPASSGLKLGLRADGVEFRAGSLIQLYLEVLNTGDRETDALPWLVGLKVTGADGKPAPFTRKFNTISALYPYKAVLGPGESTVVPQGLIIDTPGDYKLDVSLDIIRATAAVCS